VQLQFCGATRLRAPLQAAHGGKGVCEAVP
jgi:hypothetical protein